MSADESIVNSPDVTENAVEPELISCVDASKTASISLIAALMLVAAVVRFSVIPTSSCNSLIESTRLGENTLMLSLAAAGVFNTIMLPMVISLSSAAPWLAPVIVLADPSTLIALLALKEPDIVFNLNFVEDASSIVPLNVALAKLLP